MSAAARALAVLVVAVVGGCGACGASLDDLRVPGDHAFVRCLDAPPPDAREWTIGDARLALSGRTLTVAGLGDPIALAVFSGPAPSSADIAPALAPLRESPPDLVVVLGDLGDDADALRAALVALASLELPVLLVPGGRDEAPAWGEALAELDSDRVIDAAPLDVVRLGETLELLPVAGAPGGRYARSDDACGLRAEDLARRAERIGRAESASRVLVSWAAPTGPLTGDLEGADAGDPALARFARTTGARSGLHAYPREAAGRAVERDGHYAAIVSSVSGRVDERVDGARVLPSITRLSAGSRGLSTLSGTSQSASGNPP